MTIIFISTEKEIDYYVHFCAGEQPDISVYEFDVICLSETYLDSNVPLDDDNLVISGYNLIRYNHPSNTKRGGVCL